MVPSLERLVQTDSPQLSTRASQPRTRASQPRTSCSCQLSDSAHHKRTPAPLHHKHIVIYNYLLAGLVLLSKHSIYRNVAAVLSNVLFSRFACNLAALCGAKTETMSHKAAFVLVILALSRWCAATGEPWSEDRAGLVQPHHWP